MIYSEQVWVELVGGLIIARLRGVPTDDVIAECHRRIVLLQTDTLCNRVLYDALEFERPSIELVLTQQALSSALHGTDIKVAIVVPNTAIAYLARLAFGDLNYRVFYNDMRAAIDWLSAKT